MITQEALEKEIDALSFIIKSNRASLKLQTISTSDRTLIEMQIKTRSGRLKVLKQQLDDHSQ
ncbi:MAG: hypothetical protein WCK95_29045 [Alphaproteobacteria bacterium]